MQIPHKTAINIPVLMIDSVDHVTGKTGLTLTITASKAGGALASITPTVTERTVGVYQLALTAAHTDTVGALLLHITGTGADPTDVIHEVTPGAVAAATIYRGTITGATPTTSTLVDTGLTEAFTDFWAGRRILFTSGSLTNCAATITAFTPATDTLTFSAVPTAPAQNDTYVIV